MSDRKIQDFQDIIDLPHHVCETRSHLSVTDRAAQFSPFVALTGYEGVLEEIGRTTQTWRELDESEMELIDEQLREIQLSVCEDIFPEVKITYFVPDERRKGGEYVSVRGRVKKFDTDLNVIWYADGTRIPIAAISEIEQDMDQTSEYRRHPS